MAQSNGAILQQIIRQNLMTLHTCLLCKVLLVYDDRTAKVQPLTYLKTAAVEVRSHAALDHVPIADHLVNTIQNGSTGIVLFAERDITEARKGNYALPAEDRHHSFSDGILIGTLGEDLPDPSPGSDSLYWESFEESLHPEPSDSGAYWEELEGTT